MRQQMRTIDSCSHPLHLDFRISWLTGRVLGTSVFRSWNEAGFSPRKSGHISRGWCGGRRSGTGSRDAPMRCSCSMTGCAARTWRGCSTSTTTPSAAWRDRYRREGARALRVFGWEGRAEQARAGAGDRVGAGRRGPGRLLLARALRLQLLPRGAGAAADRPDRGRRGALRLRVGARLPARLPAAAADRRPAGAADGDGLHGDGDQAGGGRDRLPLRHARPAPGALRLRPPQPLLRRRPARGQGLEGAAAGAARGRARRPRQPAGDRLLRHPQGHRGGGRGAARSRPARARLPRRHGGGGSAARSSSASWTARST